MVSLSSLLHLTLAQQIQDVNPLSGGTFLPFCEEEIVELLRKNMARTAKT